MIAPPRPRGSRWTYALRCRAYDLGLAARALPSAALADPRGPLAWTLWAGGRYTRAPGVRVESDLADLAAGLEEYGRGVVEKGLGLQLSGALVRDGARVESACEALTLLALDSDAGLDPAPLLRVLDAAGAGYVWQASSSSTPAWPRWHLLLPLAAPLPPPGKLDWQAQHAHVLGWLEGAAAMPGARALDPHGRGLDPCADGLVQMSFLPARRAEDRPQPALLHRPGRAIDLPALLAATGYDPDAARALREAERPTRAPGSPREPRADDDPDRARLPVLLRALDAAGWLGDRVRGAWEARCPWWPSHGDAATDPASSEWSARAWTEPQPYWWCPHMSCAGRYQSGLRAAIPTDAWERARATPHHGLTPPAPGGGRGVVGSRGRDLAGGGAL